MLATRRSSGRTPCHTRYCPSVRVQAFLAVVLLGVLGLLSTVPLSSWDACLAEHDDDMDGLTTHRAVNQTVILSKQFAKICLSPVTSSGVRVDMSLSSDQDLRRFNVSASVDKPYTSIIHRMWKTSQVPIMWQEISQTCLDLNSKFVFCHWTDDELTQFVGTEYPWFLSTYMSYSYNIQRSDVARYLLLYSYGGTYVDLDVVCREPMAVVFDEAPADAHIVAVPARPWGISNSFMAVRRAQDPILRSVVSGLRRSATSRWYPPLPYTDAILRTGPIYLTMRVRCRIENGGDKVFLVAENYHGVHHIGSGSWHNWDGKFGNYAFLTLKCLLVLAVVGAVCVLFVRYCPATRQCLRRNLQRIARNNSSQFEL